MSSPAQRRSQRTSASATPRRSARGQNSEIPISSPAPAGPDEQLQSEASQATQRGSQATPRNTRFQTTSTQSPLFFRSSPANPSNSGPANGDEESDGGATPKASAMTIGGMYNSRSGAGRTADNARFVAHPLRIQLQPWPRPQCSKQRPRKQQQRSFRGGLRVRGPQSKK
jgi:DNA replication licensing factor MCM4